VKILGEGEIKIALTISADAFSKSAIEKIQKAGGTAEWIGGAPKKPAPDFRKIEAEKKKAAKAKAPAAAEKPAEGVAPAAAAGDAPKAAKPAKPAPKPPEEKQ